MNEPAELFDNSDEWLIFNERGETFVLPLTSTMLRQDVESTRRLSSSPIIGGGIGRSKLQELIADILAVCRQTLGGTLDDGTPAQDRAVPDPLPAAPPIRVEGNHGFIRGIETALEDALGSEALTAKHVTPGLLSRNQHQQATEAGRLVRLVLFDPISGLGRPEPGAPHVAATNAGRALPDDDANTIPCRKVSVVLLPPPRSAPLAKPGMTWIEVDSSKADQICRWLQTATTSAVLKATQPPRFCDFCQRFGHFAGNCHKKKAQAGVVSLLKVGFACHNCQKEDHYLRDCPHPRRTRQKAPRGFCASMDHRHNCPWPLEEGPLSAFHHSPLGKECMKSVVKAREALLQAQHDYQEQHAKPGFRDKKEVASDNSEVADQAAEEKAMSETYEIYKKEVARQAAKGNYLAAIDNCPEDLMPPSAFARKQYFAKQEAEESVQTHSVAQKVPKEVTKWALETPGQKETADPPKKVKKSPGRPPKAAKKLAQNE